MHVNMIDRRTLACAIVVARSLVAAEPAAVADLLIADFEGQDYAEWVATGDAFGRGPAQGTLARQGHVSGFLGKGLVNTFYNGDRTTGTLTSPEIKIERKYVNFLVGGGAHRGATCIRLLVDGQPMRTACGRSSERLDWCTWDVSEFAGKAARLKIIDQHRGGWGHVNVDHIHQSDQAKAKEVIDFYDGELVVEDFEHETYGDWQVAGDAFGAGPAQKGSARPGRVSGHRGRRLVTSAMKGDRPTGTLTSPPFTIERPYVNVLIGGGAWPGLTGANLLVDGEVVRSGTGNDNERMTWASWDVGGLKGKTARVQIVDRHRGRWGYVLVDHIEQDTKPRSGEIQGDPDAARREATARLAELGVGEIIFAARQVDPDGHWYANFSYWSSNPRRKMYHDGGKLCRMNLKTGHVTALIDDPTGGVRDPQLHYDAKKILFSYRKGGQPFYHLYEINIDGTGLRQLTDGPYDDVEPTYLPDGGIIFCSTRCNRMVNCYFVRVAIVYRCDGDGSNIRPLSSNIEQDNTPWPLPDGRILHQRWEYIDRSQVAFHHLWTMNPDGTNQMVYYGNMHPSTVMIDAKPIPGTDKVVVSFSPGHGQREHAGVIRVVDPGLGPDHRPFARVISKTAFYRDPYPLSEDCFLVAGSTDILVMDGRGQVRRIHDLPEKDKLAGLKIHEPRPIRTRARERVIPPRVDLSKNTGRLFLADIYEGRNMAGVKRGEIKRLLVLEALPKPVNFTGGWEPITFGGSFTLERILGTVPVEADGSACFDVPALRSIFFVALDENGLAVKRMQSFLTVQPGERVSCVGCHEQRTQAPAPSRSLLAMPRRPSRIEPLRDVPDLFDFPRDIQPILDQHCLHCHDYDPTSGGGPRSGGVILSGDRGPVYSHSFATLTIRGQISDGRNLGKGNYPPRALGSPASPLMAKLDGAHHNDRLPEREKQLIRLWIDSAATYPGTYAALGSGMVRGQGWGKPQSDVLKRRCGKCHTGAKRLPQSPGDNLGLSFSGIVNIKSPSLRFSPQILFNLTRPDRSALLLAPLAATAGGYAVSDENPPKGQHPTIFADTDDPDYQVLLAAIRVSKTHLDRIKRFDMPGFRPNPHYIREMQFYGVLPKELKPDEPIDSYQTDRAYWRSLWHRPQ